MRRIVRAKVLATGEKVTLVEKKSETKMFTELFGDREFKADELEILVDSANPDCMPPIPKYEPMDTTTMVKEMMDSLKGHFWRDKRVEIAKILLRREDVDFSRVAEMAEDLVKKLRSYGD